MASFPAILQLMLNHALLKLLPFVLSTGSVRTSILSSGHGHKMSARPRKARLGLQRASKLQQTVSFLPVSPPGAKFGHEPTGPLHAVDTGRREAGLGDFTPQLLRVVEERVHEVLRPAGRVAVLPVGQVPADDLGELRVLQEPPA